MRCIVNDKMYDVFFQTTLRADEFGRTEKPLKDTKCRISEVVDESLKGPQKYRPIAEAVAYLSHKDVNIFNHYVGRKIALARALRKAFNKKEDRKTVWEKYKEKQVEKNRENHFFVNAGQVFTE